MLEKMTFEEVGCTASCDELQILGQLDYQTTPWWIQEKSFHNSSPGIFPLQNRLQNTHQRAKLTPPKLPPKEKRRGKRRFWGIMMVDNPLGDRFWGGMRGWKDSHEAFLELLIPRVLYKYKMLRSKSKLLQYVFFPRKNIYPLLCCFPHHLRAICFIYRFHFAGANMGAIIPNHPTSASMEIPGLSKSWRAWEVVFFCCWWFLMGWWLRASVYYLLIYHKDQPNCREYIPVTVP